MAVDNRPWHQFSSWSSSPSATPPPPPQHRSFLRICSSLRTFLSTTNEIGWRPSFEAPVVLQIEWNFETGRALKPWDNLHAGTGNDEARAWSVFIERSNACVRVLELHALSYMRFVCASTRMLVLRIRIVCDVCAYRTVSFSNAFIARSCVPMGILYLWVLYDVHSVVYAFWCNCSLFLDSDIVRSDVHSDVYSDLRADVRSEVHSDVRSEMLSNVHSGALRCELWCQWCALLCALYSDSPIRAMVIRSGVHALIRVHRPWHNNATRQRMKATSRCSIYAGRGCRWIRLMCGTSDWRTTHPSVHFQLIRPTKRI